MLSGVLVAFSLFARRLDAVEARLWPGSTRLEAPSRIGNPTPIPAVVPRALKYLGVRYRRGGQSVKTGLDCSSFVRILFRAAGPDLPYTAAGQMDQGVAIARDQLEPGDLVFFRDTYKRGISHVGIFIGDDRFIHAAGRKRGVIISPLTWPYYSLHFAGARRLLNQERLPSVAAGG